jgi:hypothetical protein
MSFFHVDPIERVVSRLKSRLGASARHRCVVEDENRPRQAANANDRSTEIGEVIRVTVNQGVQAIREIPVGPESNSANRPRQEDAGHPEQKAREAGLGGRIDQGFLSRRECKLMTHGEDAFELERG